MSQLLKTSGWKVPSATGEDHNQWTTPANAYASDNARAISENTNDLQDYYNFAFSIPSGATIVGITTRFEMLSPGAGSLAVALSHNGGTTYTSEKTSATVVGSEASYIVGSSVDTWGRTWTDTEFSDTNFRLRVKNVSGASDVDIDLIEVNVTYLDSGSRTVVVHDTFTVSSNTALSAHNPDVGTASSWSEFVDVTGDLTCVATTDTVQGADGLSDGSHYANTTSIGTADYGVLMRIVAIGTGDDPAYLFGRIEADDDCYAVEIMAAHYKLFKKTGGGGATSGWTELDDAGQVPVANDWVELTMEGSTIKVFVNGTEVMSASDSSITAEGHGGIGIGSFRTSGDDQGNQEIDDFYVHKSSGIAVTVNPPVLSVSTSVEAPTVSGTVSFAAAVLSAAMVLNAPTVTAVKNVTVTPSVLEVASAVQAPSVVVNISVNPSTLVVGVFPQFVTVVTESHVFVNPSILNVVSSVQAPTVSVSESNEVTVRESQFVLNSPTIATTSNVQISPSSLVMNGAVQAPEIQYDKTVPLGVQSFASSLQSPTVTGAALVSPSVLSVVTSVQAPEIIITFTISEVSALFSVPTPSISTGATVSPNTLGVTSSVQAPSLAYDFSVSPAVQNLSSSVQTPTIRFDRTVSVSTLNLAASVQAPTIAGNAIVSPSVLTFSPSVQAPTIRVEESNEVTVRESQFVLNAPTIQSQGNVTVSVSALVLNSGVQAPSIFLDRTITPAVLVSSISLQPPVIGLDENVSASVVSIQASVQAPSIQRDFTVHVSALSLAFGTQAPAFEEIPEGDGVILAARTLLAHDVIRKAVLAAHDTDAETIRAVDAIRRTVVGTDILLMKTLVARDILRRETLIL